jgi:hypothetical protein
MYILQTVKTFQKWQTSDEYVPSEGSFEHLARIARWHILRPKISMWVNLGGSCNRRCWYIFYGNVVYFTAIWSILLPFGLRYCPLVYFVAIWSTLRLLCIYFSRLVIWYHPNSGKPVLD